MPDTRENQAAYPQVYNQKPGLGFPIARLGAARATLDFMLRGTELVAIEQRLQALEDAQKQQEARK
jgi:hypothetical protein